MLWADVRDGWAARLRQQQHSHPALQDAIDDVFNARIGDVSGRGKLAADMREIWMMQPRFEKRVGNTPFGMVDQPRFRASFDFMRLRADAGEVDEALAEWWQEFSMASDEVREDLVDQVRQEQREAQKNKPKSSAKSKTANNDAASDTGDFDETIDAPTNTDPAKKRRRRKRGGVKKANPAFVPNPSDGATE